MIEIGDNVKFENEFGIKIQGQVISLNAYGINGRLGIDTGSYGTYVRTENEVEKIAATEAGGEEGDEDCISSDYEEGRFTNSHRLSISR